MSDVPVTEPTDPPEPVEPPVPAEPAEGLVRPAGSEPDDRPTTIPLDTETGPDDRRPQVDDDSTQDEAIVGGPDE